MNESIYICAASLCCCLVVSSLVRIIAPSGNTSKILSLIIGLFTICCLISPFVALFKDIDVNIYQKELNTESTNLTELYDEQVLSTTGEYINSYVLSLLKNAEIVPENIKTVLGVTKEKGIYVKQMNIYVRKYTWDKADEIKSLIETSLGIEPKVTEIQYEN